MLTRDELDALDDLALISACLAPVITRIRGRGLNVKSKAFEELAPQQRALLAFYVLHGHSSDQASFWGYVRLFAAEWNIWPLFEESARHFADDRLLEVYRAMAAAVHIEPGPGVEAATELYHAYRVAAAATIRAAATRIRDCPDHYLCMS